MSPPPTRHGALTDADAFSIEQQAFSYRPQRKEEQASREGTEGEEGEGEGEGLPGDVTRYVMWPCSILLILLLLVRRPLSCSDAVMQAGRPMFE